MKLTIELDMPDGDRTKASVILEFLAGDIRKKQLTSGTLGEDGRQLARWFITDGAVDWEGETPTTGPISPT